MAGLIAAHLLPRHDIYERGPERRDNPHKALLRFRSTAVADATGIEFRPVTVHKGIWLDGGWQEPNIANANMYSRKVIGRLAERSVWNLAPAQRWIAPEDFYERLVTGLGQRIHWGCAVSPIDATLSEPFITTAPMPATLSAVGISEQPVFNSAPIYVRRYRIVDADVHQTVYFPTNRHSLYRASITGDLLICEFTESIDDNDDWLLDVYDAFSIHSTSAVAVEGDKPDVQQFGKVVPIDEGTRKALIMRLTTTFGVYSLGRYATWRNVLLDDVVKDSLVIKRLITASDYERRMYY